MEQLLPVLLIVLAFVLLFVLPARQRKKIALRQTTMQQALVIGTPILLTCGLHGTVHGLQEDSIDVQIAPGTVARFARPAVLEVRNELGGPVGGAGSSAADNGGVDLGKKSDN